MPLKMPVGQEKEPSSQGLLSESTQSLLSPLWEKTLSTGAKLRINHVLFLLRKRNKMSFRMLYQENQRSFSLCASVGEGRTEGVKGQQTPAPYCPGFSSSSIKTVCSVNYKLNKILHLWQNSEYQLQDKNLTSCFDLDFTFILISNI